MIAASPHMMIVMWSFHTFSFSKLNCRIEKNTQVGYLLYWDHLLFFSQTSTFLLLLLPKCSVHCLQRLRYWLECICGQKPPKTLHVMLAGKVQRYIQDFRATYVPLQTMTSPAKAFHLLATQCVNYIWYPWLPHGFIVEGPRYRRGLLSRTFICVKNLCIRFLFVHCTASKHLLLLLFLVFLIEIFYRIFSFQTGKLCSHRQLKLCGPVSPPRSCSST